MIQCDWSGTEIWFSWTRGSISAVGSLQLQGCPLSDCGGWETGSCPTHPNPFPQLFSFPDALFKLQKLPVLDLPCTWAFEGLLFLPALAGPAVQEDGRDPQAWTTGASGLGASSIGRAQAPTWLRHSPALRTGGYLSGPGLPGW